MKFNEVGNLGGDWETRWTKSGRAVATNSLAIGKRRKNQAGEWEDEFTSWIRLTVWGDLAEQIAQLVPGKSRVIVDGEWWARPYQDEQGGKHVAVECTVRIIGVLVRAPRSGGSQPAGGPQTTGQVQSPQNAGTGAGERNYGPWANQKSDDGWNTQPSNLDDTPF